MPHDTFGQRPEYIYIIYKFIEIFCFKYSVSVCHNYIFITAGDPIFSRTERDVIKT
jgi:hypothetical protein